VYYICGTQCSFVSSTEIQCRPTYVLFAIATFWQHAILNTSLSIWFRIVVIPDSPPRIAADSTGSVVIQQSKNDKSNQGISRYRWRLTIKKPQRRMRYTLASDRPMTNHRTEPSAWRNASTERKLDASCKHDGCLEERHSSTHTHQDRLHYLKTRHLINIDIINVYVWQWHQRNWADVLAKGNFYRVSLCKAWYLLYVMHSLDCLSVRLSNHNIGYMTRVMYAVVKPCSPRCVYALRGKN